MRDARDLDGDERLGRSDPDETADCDVAEINATLMRELGLVGASTPDGSWRSYDGRLEVFPDGRWRFAGSGEELAALAATGCCDRRGRVDDEKTVGADPRPLLTLPPVDPVRLLVRLEKLLRRNGHFLYRQGGQLVRGTSLGEELFPSDLLAFVPVTLDWLLERFLEVARYRCRFEGIPVTVTPDGKLARRYMAWALRRCPEPTPVHLSRGWFAS